jgi:6-phosphogluconolactonase
VEFIYDKPEIAIQSIGDNLLHALDKHSRVLWLVPGGSNISLAAAVMKMIPDNLSSKLHIMLTDERYGPVDHPDSNYTQLNQAGFDPKMSLFIPVLQPGHDMAETTARFAATFDKESNDAGYIIAQFGIGPDSHIAGILPGSPSSISEELAVGYNTETFSRITLTFEALKRIDTAFACVYGENKRSALEKLHNRSEKLSKEPCQILRIIPESYVYNNVIAGEATTS